MKVKICGVCRPQDAEIAASAGADFIGVILAPGRRRTQTRENAAAIFAGARDLQRVGVFVDQGPAQVTELAAQLHLDVIQLHGGEDAETAARIATLTGCAIWKTVWLSTAADLTTAIARYRDCAHGLLLDARAGAEVGGTGTSFDWAIAAAVRQRIPRESRLIVAGGLTPENVRQAINTLQPDVVDVATGVESTYGQKSETAMRAFVRNAKL